jgi:hypothetical protein
MSPSLPSGFNAAALTHHLTVLKFVNGCPKTYPEPGIVEERDTSIDISTGYGLDDPLSITGVASFSLLYSV